MIDRLASLTMIAELRWPDGFDLGVLVFFAALMIGLPALGYVFLVLDIRAYLRSLRRALVKVTNYFPHLPAWARLETPRCIAVFELAWPCTEEQLRRAYRKKVKLSHPDRGGDPQRFLVLQEQFQEALELVMKRADEPR
jgi:hypothetical protein